MKKTSERAPRDSFTRNTRSKSFDYDFFRRKDVNKSNPFILFLKILE